MKSNEETLGNAAFKYSNKFMNNGERYHGFIAGAEWEAERMYSEEEVKKLIIDFLFEKGIGREVKNVEEWFEQFKKK